MVYYPVWAWRLKTRAAFKLSLVFLHVVWTVLLFCIYIKQAEAQICDQQSWELFNGLNDQAPHWRNRGRTHRSWPVLKEPRWIRWCRRRWPWHCTPSHSAGWRSAWCSRLLPRRSPEPVQGLQWSGIIEVTCQGGVNGRSTEEWVQGRSLASIQLSWNKWKITLWCKWHRQENDKTIWYIDYDQKTCPCTSVLSLTSIIINSVIFQFKIYISIDLI